MKDSGGARIMCMCGLLVLQLLSSPASARPSVGTAGHEPARKLLLSHPFLTASTLQVSISITSKQAGAAAAATAAAAVPASTSNSHGSSPASTIGSGRTPASAAAIAAAAPAAAPTGHVQPAVSAEQQFDQTADDAACISEPEEFIKVWRSPNPSDRDRCVDPSIIVRLANGDRSWSTLESTLKGFFGRLTPLSFWAFKDAPEKYLRIGQPQSVGTYTEGDRATLSNNKSTAGQASTAFSNPRFPGIRDPQNGVSMLTQIGFGADFYRVDKFYTMFVGKRNKAQLAAAGVPSFVPTWDNVRRYYQQYIRDYIAQQNGTIGKPETFVIPSEVTEGVKPPGAGFQGLANVDMADLTGCPSQCTYLDSLYPYKAADTKSSFYPAVTPGIYTNHSASNAEQCDLPMVIASKNAAAAGAGSSSKDIGSQLVTAGRLKLAAPTQLSVNELACTDPDWRLYYLVGDFASTPTWDMINGAPVWTGNKFPGLYEICKKESKFPGPLFMSAFLNEWEKVKPTDYRKQAVLFRAFLMSGCAGNFNQLFSGNGLIYTGHGGVSSPTAHELILGAIKDAEHRIMGPEQLLGNAAFSFFCIDGTQTCCPDANCRSLGKPAW